MNISFVLIVLGIVILVKPEFIEKWIKMSNEARGTKTSITKQTKQFNKMLGILAIIFGIILLFAP